jgi:hypothetical protein
MQHLTIHEWRILSLMLEVPETIASTLPLECPHTIDAMCEDLRESHQYNETNILEFRILESCIENSQIHDELAHSALNYEETMFLVDAGYSLQDRFASKFPHEPRTWFEVVGSKLDRKGISH